VSPRERRGSHDATGLKFGIVAARFNEKYVERLVAGAVEALIRQGARDEDLEIVWVPGSLELPYAAQRMIGPRQPHAVLAFGVVIRGQTEHFRLVADQCARGLMEVGLASSRPVLNGVLACHDADQVEARLGGPVGHNGINTALAAIWMANLYREAVS
jgi:6,7-dimethyl-8-ribityllumazine synthase